jgi:hypothetical protein
MGAREHSELIHSPEFRRECLVTVWDTVVHPDYGQLCQGDRMGGCTVWLPIQFKSKPLAYKWIESGTIAEIQEGLTNLKVGFILGTIS